MRYSQHLILAIAGIWFLVFLFHERLLPWMSASRCIWPATGPHDSNEVKVLLVADPQLIDSHTYPGRNGLLLALSRHTVDAYLNRNYRALVTTLEPDYIFFLGDLLDNARNSSDDYFFSQVDRFNGLFYDKYKKRYIAGVNWFANVPGNHDLGFGDGVSTEYRSRFRETFGRPNFVKTIGGVNVVMLDSVSISAQDPKINTEAWEFVMSLNSLSPTILLSHVPLFRDPGLNCGPLRESSKFDVHGHGYQYQNSLDSELSQKLLERIHPDVIFSGDDHDYCDVNHDSDSREITVKSISMAMGIKYPAVQLLTFRKNSKTLAYNTNICYLPTPYYNVATYVMFAVASAVLIGYATLNKRVSTTAIPIYKKVSKFLRDQEEGNIGGPLYMKKESEGFWSKYQVVGVLEQWGLLGVVVVLMYVAFTVTI